MKASGDLRSAEMILRVWSAQASRICLPPLSSVIERAWAGRPRLLDLAGSATGRAFSVLSAEPEKRMAPSAEKAKALTAPAWSFTVTGAASGVS